MALLVQKFGGTSVADLQRIEHVADIVTKTHDKGHQLVVVLSAMSGQTDKLLGLASAIDDAPSRRELDVLLATGEQVTVALLAIALEKRGLKARSFLGYQLKITTDEAFGKARIMKIDSENLMECINQGIIPVVAGFQGVDPHGNITTLGRGGSDTTAVGLAAALKADECQIYTDVDGVYTTDPRMVPNAQRMSTLTFEEMLELASLGAKVLQIRAVEFAGNFNVPLRVLSTFEEGPGTLITYEDDKMEKRVVSGIAFNKDEAKLIVRGVPDQPGVAAKILGPISKANIEVDMIVQNYGHDQMTDFAFTVHRSDYQSALTILNQQQSTIGAREIVGTNNIVKISLVGVGMRSHAGIASQMFEALAKVGINIQLISTSEIKVSVIIDEKYLELGVRTLHESFGLHSSSLVNESAKEVK